MTSEQAREIFNLARQILPFLMITATFISLAYTMGHSFSPHYTNATVDLIRLSCSYLP